MADTERPKRLRGAKLLEEGYRAGYADGMRDGVAELEARQAMDGIREARVRGGLDRLRDAKKVGPPKRTRRAKAHGTERDAVADRGNAALEKANGL